MKTLGLRETRRGNAVSPASWTRAVRQASAAALVGATVFATCSPAYGSNRALLACAALDLHLLSQVEEAPSWGTVDPNRPLAVVEAMMAARHACQSGAGGIAVQIYDEIDLSASQVRRLR